MFHVKQKELGTMPSSFPCLLRLRVPVAIQLAVYELAPALRRAARDDDSERIIPHDIHDFKEVADKGRGDRGKLPAVNRGE